MTALTERRHRAGVGRRTVRSPEWRGRPPLGFQQSWGVRKAVDRRMSWRRRAIRWLDCGSAQRSSTSRSSPRCAGVATVRDGSIPLPGKAEWSLLMVKAGERPQCAYRRGQNEPHRGEAGMPERGCCGLPGSATAEPESRAARLEVALGVGPARWRVSRSGGPRTCRGPRSGGAASGPRLMRGRRVLQQPRLRRGWPGRGRRRPPLSRRREPRGSSWLGYGGSGRGGSRRGVPGGRGRVG